MVNQRHLDNTSAAASFSSQQQFHRQLPSSSNLISMHLWQAVRRLASVPGCTLVILSDANTVFINEILEHHQLAQHIQKVSHRDTRTNFCQCLS